MRRCPDVGVLGEPTLILALTNVFFSFFFCLQCSGLGATFCYMLSYLVGRPIIYKYLSERARKWSQQVQV